MKKFFISAVFAIAVLTSLAPGHKPKGHFVVHFSGASGTLRAGLNFVVSATLNPGQSVTLNPHHGDTIFLVLDAEGTDVNWVNVDDYGLRGTLTYDNARAKTFTRH